MHNNRSSLPYRLEKDNVFRDKLSGELKGQGSRVRSVQPPLQQDTDLKPQRLSAFWGPGRV